MSVMGAVRKVIRVLRHPSAGASDAESRSAERYRKAFMTFSGTYLVQLVGIISGLVTTPLLISYLGNERYGLMASATSIFLIYGSMDLGIGVSIQNAISTADGKRDYAKITTYASTGFFTYIALASVLLALSLCLIPVLPLQRILRIKTELAGSEIALTAVVLAFMGSIGLVATYAQRLCDALQQGYLTRSAMVLVRLLGLALILGAIHWRAGLPSMVTFYSMPSVAALCAFGVLQARNPWIRPRLRAVNLRILPGAASTGIVALIAGGSFSAMQTTVPLIIANRVGAEFVVSYSVTVMLLTSITAMIGGMAMPFWPAIAEAMGAGDVGWVSRASVRFFTVTLGMALLASLIFAVCARPFIMLWTHSSAAVPSVSLLAALSVLLVLLVLHANVSTVLSGLTRFRGQAFYGLPIAALTIAVAFVWGSQLGVAGIAWVFTAGFLVRCIFLLGEVVIVKRRGYA